MLKTIAPPGGPGPGSRAQDDSRAWQGEAVLGAQAVMGASGQPAARGPASERLWPCEPFCFAPPSSAAPQGLRGAKDGPHHGRLGEVDTEACLGRCGPPGPSHPGCGATGPPSPVPAWPLLGAARSWGSPRGSWRAGKGSGLLLPVLGRGSQGARAAPQGAAQPQLHPFSLRVKSQQAAPRWGPAVEAPC